ncbi:MAG: GNAT family N-acetyltransferase [Candidatus Parcubacteria bacterium]|nr:GNAT family N-acetyltransferase [Candidatus Parcubacteria bacterium]
MQIKLRKVKKADLKQIRELAKEYESLMIKIADQTIKGFGDFEIPLYQKFFSKAFNRKNKLFLAALDGNKIIGFILARIIKHKKGNKIYLTGNVSEIFITQSYRGKGIAELMWREALKWFKLNKVKFLQLHVFYGNKKPIAIYKKWGFKPMGLIMKRKI